MSVLAASLYLLPVLCLLVARAERARPLWQIALDIPLAVAADVLFVLLLARVVPLEVAALASRPVAVVAAAAYVWWRRSRKGEPLAWPRVLGARVVWMALAVAVCAFLVSMALSRKFHIWDRFWHLSLVSSLRVQRLPFANVYEPGHSLAYHYSGDAIAALLQTFSLGSLHASHALSLAHDLLFALTGATLTLLFASWGMRGALVATLATLCFLWAGPTALLRTDGKQFSGYNFVNFYTLSYRPHVVLAGLLLVGFVGAMLVRLRRPPALAGPPVPRAQAVRAQAPTAAMSAVPLVSTAVPLVVCTATLAICDESSIALLGLGLGITWLVYPDVLHPKRTVGIGLLALLAVAVVGTNLVYAGLLSPGAARPGVRLVDWRSPGFGTPFPPLAWSAPNGLAFFVGDTLALVVFAGAAAWAAIRARSRAVTASAVFVIALVALGLFGLARFDLDPRHSESHRFVTAPMLAAPLVGIFWLLWRREPRQPGRSPLVFGLVAGALGLPALSTLAWWRSPGEPGLPTQSSFGTSEDFYSTDCVRELGGGLGLKAEPLYVSQNVFYLYTGCRPTFMPGSNRGRHQIKTSTPLLGQAALAELDRDMVAEDADLGAICSKKTSDPICVRAAKAAPCTPIGTTRGGMAIERCTLDPETRKSLVASGKRPKLPSQPPPDEPPEPAPAPSAEPDESGP